MKLHTTFFARIVVLLVTLAAFSICFVLLPELAREEMVGKPKSADITLPFLTTAYVLATPFFIALFHSFKLLQLIDKKRAFSEEAIRVLRNIKICAIVFGVLIFITFIGGGMLLRHLNPAEDAPPFFMFGFVLTFISIIFAVFVAVLQKLLRDAVALKSENDLIV
jgi:hypothetical protein